VGDGIMSKKINVLIPMAGAGSRFTKAGYDLPKPLIDVGGKPMIHRVVDSLSFDANYMFIIQKEHYEKYDLVNVLNHIADPSHIFVIDGMTDGAARTTLAAVNAINNDTPLIIANSDQLVAWDSSEFVKLVKDNHAVAVFKDNDPKWSYAQINNGVVTEVAEKRVISDYATTGIYGWKTGADYVKYAEQMIDKDIRTNNEFYIAPVYNEAILNGDIVLPYFVEEMHGIGTPEDLELYLEESK
jgi:NDP-sugar pyrophosphorylase family protein